MAAGFLNETDLYRLYNIYQNTLIRYSVDFFISSLREFFNKDSLYHCVLDQWGFPMTPDHTDLHPEAGLHDDLTTRVYIGRHNRHNAIYYPAILIKAGSFRHVPISLNADRHRVDYETVKYIDGYGNIKLVQQPSEFILSGAWEGSINIDIKSRGIRERDDLVELVSIFFAGDIIWQDAYRAGISIKPYGVNISAPNDSNDDRNDKLFTQTVSVDIRSEWCRTIPVSNIVEFISFCVEFDNLDSDPPTPAPNIAINTTVDLIDELNKL